MLRLTNAREKVLKVFLENPKEEVHLREVVRRTDLSPYTVHTYLKEFLNNDLLAVKERGRMKFFRINLENKQILKIFEMFEVDKTIAFKKKYATIARIMNEFTKRLFDNLGENLSIIILFGSAARGEMKKSSDIDVLIVVKDKVKAEKVIKKISKEVYSYGNEIIPVLMSIGEFRNGMRAQRDFFKTLWEDRLILFGESIFWDEVLKI